MSLLCAGASSAVGAPGAVTSWPPRGHLYSPAAQSPFPLGVAPTSMTSVEAAGDGFADLVVGSAPGRRVQLLEMRAGRIAGVRSRAVDSAGGDGARVRLDEVLLAGDGRAQVFDFRQLEFLRAQIVPLESVAAGLEPSAVLAKRVGIATSLPGDGGVDYEYGWTSDYVVADRAGDDVLLVDRDWRPDPFRGRGGRLKVLASVPVGDAPVALAAAEGAPGYFYVANAGSGTLTQLSDVLYDGRMRTETIPVGGEPVAIATGNFITGDHRDPEIAVADRARDQVELLDSRRDPAGGPPLPYEVVARYPVGDAPVALLAEPLDESPGEDLAVVNSGSDNVSLLLGTGSGFVSGGTYPVGRDPVAIEPTGYGLYFDHDLAVANRGSRDVTILVRNECGHCRGHPARLRIGTAGDDSFGGERGPNETDGLGGDDRIQTGAGGDCIRGNRGDDVLQAGSGDDLVWPGPGEDEVRGQAGDDTIYARDGDRDRIDCGTGVDLVYADAADELRHCEKRR